MQNHKGEHIFIYYCLLSSVGGNSYFSSKHSYNTSSQSKETKNGNKSVGWLFACSINLLGMQCPSLLNYLGQGSISISTKSCNKNGGCPSSYICLATCYQTRLLLQGLPKSQATHGWLFSNSSRVLGSLVRGCNKKSLYKMRCSVPPPGPVYTQSTFKIANHMKQLPCIKNSKVLGRSTMLPGDF